MTTGEPRVAVVHDWLTGMRGGEKVLEAICELFPGAELFTLVRVPGTVSPALEGRSITSSAVGWLPAVGRFYRHLLPFFPAVVETFDLDRYDLVISSSHCAVKSVVRPGRAVHVCYCHSPMRYAWDQFASYFGPRQVGRVPHALLRPVMAALARWDAATAGRVDAYVANSRYVAGRIRRYYNRGSTVVYPPVDTEFYRLSAERPAPSAERRAPSAERPFFLIVSALVPYKKIDVAIAACRAAGAPLKVVGSGPELASLQRMAGPDVQFLGWRSNEEIRDLYQRAAAVLLPGVEDFGMVPVEAQACGCPVVALGAGGACETVVDGETGVLVSDGSVEAMTAGLNRARSLRFDPNAIRRQALRFSRERFKSEFAAVVDQVFAVREANQMMRRHNRLLVLLYVVADAILGMAAFGLAYAVRFYSGIPVWKGIPPFEWYVTLLPWVGALVPIAYHVQGLYRLRRGRSRVDDFFAVFVGSTLAVVLGIIGTLYYSTYYLSDELKNEGVYEVAQLVWLIFLVINVTLTYTSREVVREVLARRWKAGIGLKRVLIAGAGDLGRLVADKLLEHRELGFKVIGFLDDRAGDHIGYRGLPLLGTLAEADEIIRLEKIDHLYVTLPLEEHVKMLGLVEATNREGVDVHVVPDLLQFIALRARLENLDGVPIISLNDVPLRGFNSVLKRSIDVATSGLALARVVGAVPDHRGTHQTVVAGGGLLHAGTHGARWEGVPGLQVPIDVRGGGGRNRSDLGP